MTDAETLRALLLERSVSFGDFVLSSGQRSSYYIDARKTTMSARGQAVIGRLGLTVIRERGWSPRAVGGLTLGADPVAYAIARASLDLPPILDAFSVRKTAKDHGLRRRIEGNFNPGDRVVVVEDVITSGSSAIQAIEAVQADGGTVVGVLAVVDREQGGAAAIHGVAGIEVVSMTTISQMGATSK
jgi:orotate phosphoribosyltransferase